MKNAPESGEGLSDDLKRLLARAEAADEGTDVYVEGDDDEDEEADDGELEESFGTVDRGESAGEDINGGQLQISEFGPRCARALSSIRCRSLRRAPCRTCATA